MKKVRLTTLHGLEIGLGGLTSDVDWFLNEIEKTDKSEYRKLFKNPKISRRKFYFVYQDERYTHIVIEDVYGKNLFLQIKEY